MTSRRSILAHALTVAGIGATGWVAGRIRRNSDPALQITTIDLDAEVLATTTLLTESGAQVELRSLLDKTRVGLVYVVREQCYWCQTNRPVVNALASELAGQSIIIGITLDQVVPPQQSYVFPLYRIKPGSELRAQLKVTPLSVVLNTEAGIIQVIEGAYSPHKIAELRQLLEVTGVSQV